VAGAERADRVTRVGTRTVTVIGARPGDRDIPAVWLDPDYGVVRLVTREQLPNGAKLVDLTLSEHRLFEPASLKAR
jgi:hypothetical protein